ncbi:MAG: hypothetical protein K6T83_16385 [Alicyclobacillus sp.]|nr:hypothetical protein [Alicyclobacillus sp.]
MKTKVWIGAVTVLVIASGILGYVHHPYNAPQTTSPSFLSQQQVAADIQKQQLTQNKIAQDIRVIHMNTLGNEGFAFVSFDVNGQQEFASLLISSKGHFMSIYTTDADDAAPIRFNTLSGDGFEYVTGGILDHPNVKSAVVIWSDGTATTVPVQKGFFWYARKVQMPADAYVKQVIGVTKSGAIIRNQ